MSILEAGQGGLAIGDAMGEMVEGLILKNWGNTHLIKLPNIIFSYEYFENVLLHYLYRLSNYPIHYYLLME